MDQQTSKAKASKCCKLKADFSYMAAYGYRLVKEIGRGGYGVVFKAVHRHLSSELAIKVNFNTVSREIIYAQMAFLVLVKEKRNLPRVLNIFVHQDFTHIVMEYFKFTPFIAFFNTFSLEDVKHYILEMLIGLRTLKGLGIYHRDIKPGNFLYNPDTKRGIIIDFGLAEIDPKFVEALEEKEGDEDTLRIYHRLLQCLNIIGRNKIGTENYMPLESILHYPKQSYQSDIWPVGVTLLQFVLRKYNVFNNVRMINRPPHLKNNYYINYLIELASFFGPQVVTAQCRRIGYRLKLPADITPLPFRDIAAIEGYDDLLDDLLRKMLDIDQTTRINVERAIQHPFFDSVRHQHQH